MMNFVSEKKARLFKLPLNAFQTQHTDVPLVINQRVNVGTVQPNDDIDIPVMRMMTQGGQELLRYVLERRFVDVWPLNSLDEWGKMPSPQSSLTLQDLFFIDTPQG